MMAPTAVAVVAPASASASATSASHAHDHAPADDVVLELSTVALDDHLDHGDDGHQDAHLTATMPPPSETSATPTTTASTSATAPAEAGDDDDDACPLWFVPETMRTPTVVSAFTTLSFAGERVVKALDVMGDALADFVGITESRYQYVLDAYERHKHTEQMERAERREQRRRREVQVNAAVARAEAEHSAALAVSSGVAAATTAAIAAGDDDNARVSHDVAVPIRSSASSVDDGGDSEEEDDHVQGQAQQSRVSSQSAHGDASPSAQPIAAVTAAE